MNNKTGGFILFLSKAMLFIVILAIFAIGQRLFYEETLFYFWGDVVVLLLYAGSLYLTSRIYNSFNFGNAALQEIIISWVLCFMFANVIQYLILGVRVEKLLPAVGFLVILAAQTTLVIPILIVINRLYYRLNPAHDTIIIYGNKEKLDEFCSAITRQRNKFTLDHIISQDMETGALLDLVDKAQSVFFLDIDEKKLDWLLEYCYLHNKHAYLRPTFSKILLNTAGIMWLYNDPVFSLKSPEPGMGILLLKRLMDVIISFTAIVLLSWLMLGIWVAVRFYDRYPAIYRQVRVTRDSRRFVLYKFRSMRPDAEDDGVPRLTAKGDDRITPVGRFIRKTRLDELPQLFNVLSGAMSIVGPRPERPEIAKQYEEIYPNFAFRTKVKAGITGFAQIYGRYNTAPEEKLFLDIMYIETFSILQDITLMLQTLRVIFQGSSTEGIEKDSTTALG
jgi:exopolysaccharide biosynthesis polyprenyl glycosylphosphotransferase